MANYFSNNSSDAVATIRFADNTVWDVVTVMGLVKTIGTENNDVINGLSNISNRIAGLAGNDSLLGNSLADMLDGGNGNDQLVGYVGNDRLFGGLGDDNLSGGGGTDLLDGGVGNDFLDGGIDNDIYCFAKGAGVDRNHDYDTTTNNNDLVEFADVTSSEITAVERHYGTDLILKYGNADQITIQGYFGSAAFRGEQFRFSDGVTWDDA